MEIDFLMGAGTVHARTARLWLQQRLESSFIEHRHRTAILGEEGVAWTFADLDRSSREWMDRLLDSNLRLDLPVALVLPRGPGLVAAMLGVLRAGGAWFCCEPPLEEGGKGELADFWKLGAVVDSDGLHLHAPSAAKLLGWDSPAPHPAFALVRTSGTMGRPCGVLQNPAGLMRHVDYWVRRTGITAESRLSWLSPPGTAAAHSHLFAALLHGATLCPLDVRLRGVVALTGWLADLRISHLHLTPSVLRAWLGGLGEPVRLPELKAIKLGGEPAWASDAKLVGRLLEPCPRLFNGLGLSEANGNIALNEIDPLATQPSLLPVGPPVPGLQIKIAARWRPPWRCGRAGEIVVRGPHLSFGLWPRENGATLRDIDRPLRILKTGDRGRLKNGVLTHLGRMDRKIAHRGRTLDLAQIESVAALLPPVRQAAAISHPDGTGYVLALAIHPDTPALRAALRKALTVQLPAPPRRLAFFAGFPMRAGGKLDIPELMGAWPKSMQRTVFLGREGEVAAIWAEVLGHDEFGPEETFLEAGGDSLAALQVLALVERKFGVHLTAADFIRHPTVRAIARRLEPGGRPDTTCEETPREFFEIDWIELDRVPETNPVLISPGGWNSDQELWLAAGLTSGLRERHTIACTRTNLIHAFSAAPRDFDAIIRPLLPRLESDRAPILIGGCVSSSLILALGAKAMQLGKQPVILLIDPLLQGFPGLSGSAPRAQVPDRVAVFYRLLREQPVPPGVRVDHLFLASETPDLEMRAEAWRPLLAAGGRIHTIPGNHQSCLREHGLAAARAIASVLVSG